MTSPGTAGVPPALSGRIPRGWYSRGYLPHFDAVGTNQFVTFRLADSVPEKVIEGMQDDLKNLSEEKRVIAEQARINKYLDLGRGSCSLGIPEVAQMVESALQHFDGDRYRLLSWVIMPNHVHTLVEIGDSHSLDSIVHSWKSFTAKEANKLLNRSGAFWFREYFDRFIRDERHFWSVVRYVEENPVKTKLCPEAALWPYSSAGNRLAAGGTPAVPGEVN